MFLKRIDLHGFKSFAEKTHIEFSPGVTAVVGPNGSGKSNVADAIRWVLGEQSAKNLRGSKMEDVIFAGSESRRSINFCEVSLTLDNVDRHLPVVFDEVTITRRVFRSGESEYKINGQSCRLRDIHELFMDTGLGRESYSIIGQGRIEEMLSTRPEDRRGPFEDAAGIVKFRFRRKEAERKLDETGANLVRVDDVLAELEDQEGPLQLEAEQAAEYKRLADEKRQLDISLLVYDIEHLEGRWHSLAKDVSDLSKLREDAARVLADHEARFLLAKDRAEKTRRDAERLQQSYVDTIEQRERAQAEVALQEQQLSHHGQRLLQVVRQQEDVMKEIGDEGKAEGALIERFSAVESLFHQKSEELRVALESLSGQSKAAMEEELAVLNADYIDVHQQAANARNEVKAAEDALSLDGRRRERLSNDREQVKGEKTALEEKLSEMDSQIADLQERRDTLEGELKEANQAYRQLAERESEEIAKIHRVESELASLRSRLELLQDLEDGYDGYALGVKTVMSQSQKGRLQGVHGTVANLIKVANQYELAVETALGASIQNIVVQSEQDGRAAIEFLKQRHAGRATFMPLEVIRSRRLSNQDLDTAREHAGCIGAASDLVDCDEQFRSVVENLLGNVLIAKTLKDANEIARILRYRMRLVTLEGDVVSPGGIMSGGSHQRRGPGLLGRSRERQEAESSVKAKQQERNERINAHQAIREQMIAIQENIQKMSDALRQQSDEATGLRERQAGVTSKIQSVDERLDLLLWESAQLDSDGTSLTERLQRAQAQRELVTRQIRELEERIQNKRSQIDQWENEARTLQEHVTSLRVEVATVRQERDQLRARREEVTSRVDRLHQRKRQLADEHRQGLEDEKATSARIDEMKKRLVQLQENVSQLEVDLDLLRLARGDLEHEVKEGESTQRKFQEEVAKADERLHRAEVHAERADVELNHALTKMGENFEMTYEWAKEHFPAVVDASLARQEAARLQGAMNRLGTVRLSAIDEWNRLSDRLGFLRTQREDLERAREELQTVISEIDTEMAARFQATFEQIRQEFRVAFRQLFGGGHADLQLTEADEPLKAGIEVVAEPPGKRLQNLNLMSGGERALIAMALLFAILHVRPVPFCVLDEVEAALDEANVGRFAQKLRTFADESQFIVITHRRGTMEEADALYGVTMQESGVSSLISVRLSDREDFESA